MKTLILSLATLSLLATLAQAAENPSTPSSAPDAPPFTPPSIAPAATNNTAAAFNAAAAFPWQAGIGIAPGRLSRLLADLQDDIDKAVPSLAALNDNVDHASTGAQAPRVDSAVAQYASGNGVLLARDLSTLVSQNLSVNLGQNLATSLAVPTCPPQSTWGNGPGMVLANVGGTVVAIPTFPPRTAWGNGPGVVVTTPGGAVYSLVTGYSIPAANAAADGARDVLRQLSIVHDDLDRVLRYLATVNTPNTIAPAPTPPPTSPAVYLSPTGR